MRRLSLKTRLLFGAMFWTLGLFAVAGIGLNFLIFHHPYAPVIFHRTFTHVPLSILIASLLMFFGFLQVRRGVSPINQLRDRLAAVHQGREPRLSGDYPAEVQPLVDDLNALLDERGLRVTRAIAKAGDLAHGLKTPLAVLAHEAQQARAAGHAELAEAIAQQVDRMQRQIDYHLAQARAAASAATPGARADVAASADGLARTLRRLHADRGLTITVDVPAGHTFQGQREDLDEMLGNLLDNACKWARARVALTSALAAGRLTIDVDDDGPGLDPSMREAVLQRGVRADQAAHGSGLGLAIVRDLAGVYGGDIELTASPLGGLRARLGLPGN
ncbi:MAG TPA: ATP-binding protein [Vicinamibacterales bacterium]|nr:ATP-binding protein [Vicinamibacterales bacterium]